MSTRTTLATLALAAAGTVAAGALASTRLSPGRQPGEPTASFGTPSPANGDIDAGTFRQIAEAQMPIVVSLRTLTESRARDPFAEDELLRRFFGFPNMPPDRVLEGAGSGFIIDDNGLILTNNHVVADASRIEVTFFPDPESDPNDARRYEATVLGRDPLTDSALIQVTDDDLDLPVAALGNSDAMRPGDWVMAIGNPFALSHSVTVGVISATARPVPMEGRFQRALQSDAAVNPGNSGGPLLNIRGEVIGVNTAILSPGGGGNVGISFAVPINAVRELIPQLRAGDVRRGRLGIEIRDVPAPAAEALGLGTRRGSLVATVEPGGPAERAGIRPGDVIVEFEGEPIDDADELVRLVSNAAPGTPARVVLMRDRQSQTLTVTLDELRLPGAAGREPAQQSADVFGMTLAPLPSGRRPRGLGANEGGAIVREVTPGSPAAEGGVRPGDIVLEVNRTAVASLDETTSRLRAVAADAPAFVLVLRGDQRIFLVLAR